MYNQIKNSNSVYSLSTWAAKENADLLVFETDSSYPETHTGLWNFHPSKRAEVSLALSFFLDFPFLSCAEK